MDINYLETIIDDLKELRDMLYLAERTKDGRCREKRVREAKLKISSYAQLLTPEVAGYLEETVGTNALSFKWGNSDIDSCIRSLKELLYSIEE